MWVVTNRLQVRFLLAALASVAGGGAYAQEASPDRSIVINGRTVGPEIKGIIAARHGDRLKVSRNDGTSTTVAIDDATRIRRGSGLFGSTKAAPSALLNGLPVTIQTVWSGSARLGDGLLARQVNFSNKNLKLATMIRNGTDQRFEEQAAAVESLRGRMGDIDKYNVKGVTNVHFDTGKAELSAGDKAALCSAASSARGMENALMLVVGYTDSTGGDEINQELSEKRAGRVINYLQQTCRWKPYRMLTPTGMAKADPLASNATAAGKAQNRRVAVNILVSKSADGL